MKARTDRLFAQELDRADEMKTVRGRFRIQPGVIYMDGNSLGLLSRDAEEELLRILGDWGDMGIEGWLEGDPPWFNLGEELGLRQAAMMGARVDEIVAASSTTVNLHSLLGTFYRPEGDRVKILADDLNFPSDLYAIESHLRMRGRDPARDLVRVPSRDGRFLEEDDIVEAMSEDIAVAVLPSVLYRSGQLLDMGRLAREARDRGIAVGFDCSHSAGAVKHRLSDWDVDFAFWCTYKYLNSGPGGIASLYVNRRHFRQGPAMAGWWGYDKARQFEMNPRFCPARSAGGWQIGTIAVLSAAPLLGSLRIFNEVGIDRVRRRSLKLTSYLIELVDGRLPQELYGCRVGTPREAERRGGHVAVEHPEAYRITRALRDRGVVPDFRPPNIIRMAPVALYNSFCDVWDAVDHIRDILDTGAYEEYDPRREPVS